MTQRRAAPYGRRLRRDAGAGCCARLPRPGLPRSAAVARRSLAAGLAGRLVVAAHLLAGRGPAGTVAGVSGPDAPPDPRGAHRGRAQHDDARREDARAAHRGRPVPGGQASARLHRLPARMRIEVIEQVPVAMISAGGVQVAVSSDGTLLHGDHGPRLAADDPARRRARRQRASAARRSRGLQLLAAAPYQLLAKVQPGLRRQRPRTDRRSCATGPSCTSATTASWAPSGRPRPRVLADSGSAGADYIDVTDASRPAPARGLTRPQTRRRPPARTAPPGRPVRPDHWITGSSGGG